MTEGTLGRLLHSPYVQALTLVLLIQAALFYTAAHGEKIPLAKPLDEFPAQIGPWTLQQTGVVEPEVRDVLKADDLMTRWYADPALGGVDLFVAYFKTQRTGQSPHSPKNCLPGSGWSPSATGFIDVPIPSRGETIRVNRYIVTKGDSKDVVLYWYQAQNRVIADEFAAKFYLVADSIRYHRSDTALVRVVVPVQGVTEQEAVARAARFVQAVYPELKAFLPNS
jgi:EpsI family protein